MRLRGGGDDETAHIWAIWGYEGVKELGLMPGSSFSAIFAQHYAFDRNISLQLRQPSNPTRTSTWEGTPMHCNDSLSSLSCFPSSSASSAYDDIAT